jgi:hypothetical protein
MNYDENNVLGKNFSVVPSICKGFVNTCPMVFLRRSSGRAVEGEGLLPLAC